MEYLLRGEKMSIPSEMNALQITEHHKDVNDAIRSLQVVSKPIPRPKPGQVLVKMEATPCNPSDLLFLQGKYVINRSFPTIPGWEGAGTVVACGGGFLARMLVGKRVACAGLSPFGGTWAEYFLVDAKGCVPLKPYVSSEQGATLLINPLTVLALIEKVKKEKHAAIVQTAAASQLGQMVCALAAHENIPVINIVRREEQENLLMRLGAKYVLNSEAPNFVDLLKGYSHDLKATIAFEAIAGKMTGIVFNALPRNSTVVLYGSLSMEPCEGIGGMSLIGENKKLEGFMLSDWIAKKNFWSLYRATSHLQNLMREGVIKTVIRKVVSLKDAPMALLEYQKEMTTGKIIINPTLKS